MYTFQLLGRLTQMLPRGSFIIIMCHGGNRSCIVDHLTRSSKSHIRPVFLFGYCNITKPTRNLVMSFPCTFSITVTSYYSIFKTISTRKKTWLFTSNLSNEMTIFIRLFKYFLVGFPAESWLYSYSIVWVFLILSLCLVMFYNISLCL